MVYWQKEAVQDSDKQSQCLRVNASSSLVDPHKGRLFLLRDWIETNETISTDFNYFKSIRTGL